MYMTQHKMTVGRVRTFFAFALVALGGLLIGVCLAVAQDDPNRVPNRPNEKPRGRFQPSTAYVQRFSHAPPQVLVRPKATPKGRIPLSPTSGIMQLEEMRKAQYAAEQAMQEKETMYRPQEPAMPAPTPRFQLPGTKK